MLLDTLHEEHEEAAALLDRIAESEDGKKRGALFSQLAQKLGAHFRAESKILYARLAKDDEAHETALEGDAEHDFCLWQIEKLARARNKASGEWLARVRVLKEFVSHHVAKEEGELWPEARRLFDEDELEQLEGEFERETERLMRGGRAAERSAAAARSAFAGSKPRRRKRAGAPRKRR